MKRICGDSGLNLNRRPRQDALCVSRPARFPDGAFFLISKNKVYENNEIPVVRHMTDRYDSRCFRTGKRDAGDQRCDQAGIGIFRTAHETDIRSCGNYRTDRRHPHVSKFSSGDPDTSKTAASWFGACIFMIVAGTILKSFFIQT